ncbi:MAG: fused MFS/spermidine synthase, partial [Candidatus Binatia bacterium]
MVRFLLNIVVFVSGAVLMGLEIAGSRVLAPYFGSSIFVWGSLISVVMAALSIGYYWGGWLSAREPSYARLLTLLLVP